jgi:hypothetical protein
MNTAIAFLDFIHRHLFSYTHSVSEIEFCLRLRAEFYHFGSIGRPNLDLWISESEQNGMYNHITAQTFCDNLNVLGMALFQCSYCRSQRIIRREVITE